MPSIAASRPDSAYPVPSAWSPPSTSRHRRSRSRAGSTAAADSVDSTAVGDVTELSVEVAAGVAAVVAELSVMAVVTIVAELSVVAVPSVVAVLSVLSVMCPPP